MAGTELGAPAKSATRSEWDIYADELGLDPEEYGTKEDLIAACEAKAEESEAPVTEGEATAALPAEGKKGKYPEGYEDAAKPWKKAYDHAIANGNPPKTAVIFADLNMDAEEFNV